jgi:hypothetical protein
MSHQAESSVESLEHSSHYDLAEDEDHFIEEVEAIISKLTPKYLVISPLMYLWYR